LQSPASSVVHPGITETYWVSLDRKNGALRYGKKYLNAGLTLYEVNLKHMSGDGVPEWNDETYASFDNLTHVTVTQVGGDIGALRLVTLPLPVVVDLPPYVVTHDTLTLDELASGVVTVPDNLPLECQKLYYNVAGPNIVLDTPDFPDFSAAIERSIHTPGLIGYELLKKKANHFGKEDFAGTYLRITLGRDLGDSPGPPYVLEIWPSGHYSPIHDHGNSYAVIRVLHGKIQAFYYDSLELPPRQLGPPALLKKGDVTWISDKSYQVHQLVNPPEYGSLCCTIQCYQYGSQDKKHYEFFDYLADTDGDHKPDVKKPFTPNSDMAFTLFKQKIKAEW
ncbi:RmlC-like cupin domain-containing protein, partial [Gloeopeniophorella convolvens]